MATSVRLTADDLLALPDDEHRYELIDGELVEMPPSSEDHSWIGALFVGYLVAHVVPRKLGRVYQADLGVKVQINPDRVLSPDAAFIRADRLPRGRDRRRHVQVIPDLVVEVVSPNDRAAKVAEKVDRYRDLGVPLVVVVWPETRTLDVHSLGQPPRTLTEGDIFEAGDIVPDFRLPIADLFIDMDD
jgi:Uma2 family endonuclease